MVYISNESVKMTILRSKITNITKIGIINQIDKSKVEVDLEEGDIDYSKNTIVIKLNKILPELKASGQYDYYLYKDEDVVESGILQFNDFTKEINSYNINQKIIQYEG